MKKKTIIKGLQIIAFMFFLGILLYPSLSNYLFERNGTKVVENYKETSYGLDDKEIQRQLDNAHKYNDSIMLNNHMNDIFTTSQKIDNQYYLETLNMMQNGMIGHLVIPKINVDLPIYHGTKENVLQVGVGHHQNSSVPVGGKGTHAVLTAHRGLPNAELFTHIDQLKKEDVFYIKILNQTLAYQVDQILVVEPNETESLTIQENHDYVTLVTCTPYSVNTHRLLVRGKRIDYVEAQKKASDIIEKSLKVSLATQLVLLGFTFIGIVIFVIKRRRKNAI